MTPQGITFARRVASVMPESILPRRRDVYGVPPGTRIFAGGLQWEVLTDRGDCVPVLGEFALLGWLIMEFRRVADDPCAHARYHPMVEDWWIVDSGGTPYNKARGSTEVEALVAALKAALEATGAVG